jgi:hypothetical protein
MFHEFLHCRWIRLFWALSAAKKFNEDKVSAASACQNCLGIFLVPASGEIL